ncbi:MAG: hypothetical protein ACRDGW_03385 [Actinomycetota bacterium]
MRARTFAIVALTATLLAACGRLNDGGPGSGGGIDHPTGPDDLVIRIAHGGGFVPVEYNLRALPGISIYGDGRMIVGGPQIEIYPGPALPNLQVRRLTQEAVQAILGEARKAGLLGADATYHYPCVADAATTTFTVVAEGRTHTVSAYALDFNDLQGTSDCRGVDAEARAKLYDFQAKLGGLDGWLPEGSIGQEQEFEPSEMRLYVLPYRGDRALQQEPVDWPLAAELDAFGEPDPNLTDIRCGVVSGEGLATLLQDARSANELTPWISDGSEFALLFRPLLPDEHTC